MGRLQLCSGPAREQGNERKGRQDTVRGQDLFPMACHGMLYCDSAVDAHEAVTLLNQKPSLSESGLLKGTVQTVCTPVVFMTPQ